MDFSIWLAFAGTSLVLAVAPGPDNLFVLAQSAMHGARQGLWVVAGLCLGLVVQTICAACGLAAVIAALPALFFAIKLAGACYLLYLAWQALKHAKDPAELRQTKKLSTLALIRRGTIMNITNPKVQIFFLAFFPQFVSPGTTGLALITQMVIQGLTFIAATAIVFGLIALASGALTARLHSGRASVYLNRGSALIFILLAVFTLFAPQESNA